MMTQDELNRIIEADPYLIARKDPTEAEIRLYLKEVDFRCPLCGVVLQSRNQVKLSHKRFEIAHIYPNRPTILQYEALRGVERLGDDSEAFENKIALCKPCHSTQDFHTTLAEYNKLLNIKKGYLLDTVLNDLTTSLGLEKQIEDVISKLTKVPGDELVDLNYSPVNLTKKFSSSDALLKTKIWGYVSVYYTFIRDEFRTLDGKNGFLIKVLCDQIKACFLKINTGTDDKVVIFNHIVKWIKEKTLSTSTEACEAVVAYFVQNCEVFYEITE